MNTLPHWFTAPEWAQLVTALLHTLWQGALIALVLALALRRVVNPHWRYRLALLALVLIPASGMLTWAALSPPNRPLRPTPQPPSNDIAPLPQLSENPPIRLMLLADRSPASPPSPWTAWLALLWAVGASAMLARASVKLAGAERLRRSCQPLEHPQVSQLLAEARRAVGLARKVRVVVTDKLTSPAVVGVLVPTLVLPLSLTTALTPDQIRFILLHELAHIRRGDYLANLVQLFLEAFLFFNPAVWWISHQVRREREACCDALAIKLSGAPADYARTLVHVAETIIEPAPEIAPAFGDKRETSSLTDRVQRLLVPGYRPSLRLTWRAMIAAFVLGTFLLMLCAEGTRIAVAQIAKPLPPTADSSHASTPESKPSVGVFTQPSGGTSVGVGDNQISSANPDPQPTLDISAVGPNCGSFYDQAIGKSWFTNRGRIRLPGLTVEADSIELDHQTGQVIATGNVRVERPGATIHTARLELNIRSNPPPAQSRGIPANGSAPATTNAAGLFTRMFKVDANTFGKALESITAAPVGRTNIAGAVRSFLATLGVELSPPKSVYYNERSGELLIRATAEDLEITELALQVANKGAPQVNIETRFIEVSPAELQMLMPDLMATMKPADGQHWSGFLSEPQMEQVLERIRTNKSINLLSELEVTTASGRQAELQTVEAKTIVTGINPKALTPPGATSTNSDGSGETLFLSTNMLFGPVINVIPTITPDGYSVKLMVNPRMTEFLGYDSVEHPTNNLVVYVNGKKEKAAYPLPRFRTQQMTDNAVVRDGNTLVLGAAPVERTTRFIDKVPLLGDIPLVGRLFRSESSQVHTNVLLVFITPTIIDPAGNRVNPEAKPSPAGIHPVRK